MLAEFSLLFLPLLIQGLGYLNKRASCFFSPLKQGKCLASTTQVKGWRISLPEGGLSFSHLLCPRRCWAQDRLPTSLPSSTSCPCRALRSGLHGTGEGQHIHSSLSKRKPGQITCLLRGSAFISVRSPVIIPYVCPGCCIDRALWLSSCFSIFTPTLGGDYSHAYILN